MFCETKKYYLLFNKEKMHSSNLDQYFVNKCNPTDLKDSLESILCSIDPGYVDDFLRFRDSLLSTISK